MGHDDEQYKGGTREDVSMPCSYHLTHPGGHVKMIIPACSIGFLHLSESEGFLHVGSVLGSPMWGKLVVPGS